MADLLANMAMSSKNAKILTDESRGNDQILMSQVAALLDNDIAKAGGRKIAASELRVNLSQWLLHGIELQEEEETLVYMAMLDMATDLEASYEDARHDSSLPGKRPNMARDYIRRYDRFQQQYSAENAVYDDKDF
ncbi:hypothetical protein FI667_g13128, partial [Globisporangium splendens]